MVFIGLLFSHRFPSRKEKVSRGFFDTFVDRISIQRVIFHDLTKCCICIYIFATFLERERERKKKKKKVGTTYEDTRFNIDKESSQTRLLLSHIRKTSDDKLRVTRGIRIIIGQIFATSSVENRRRKLNTSVYTSWLEGRRKSPRRV